MDKHKSYAHIHFVGRAQRAASFLDAVFVIHYYNHRRFPPGEIPEITPGEVFGTFDEDAYAKALEVARALLAMATPVGLAAYSYEGAEPIDDAIKQMKDSFPGFSEESYNLVLSHGRDMLR